MGRVVKGIIGIGAAVVGAVTGNWLLVAQGAALVGGALIQPGEQAEARERNASSSQIQLGEVSREAVVGRAAVTGSLVDGFNYGGEHGTDWEVLILALADHRSDALEGFFVNDTYVPFAGDGMVAGYNNQLQVYFRDGQWDQALPAIVTANGPGWTANDRGRGITYVVVAYKADDQEAENPVWTAGRPRFRWVLRGLKCYQARKDPSVGGSGAHDWADPATREWTDNPIDCRYNWARGIYLGDKVDDPNALVVGRGLTTVEAPPANVFARANLCDELVDGEKRYRVGGAIRSTERYLDVESDFATACAGTIVQPEGAVEIDPGAARAPVAHITDADLVDGTKVTFARRLSINDDGWINTVFARFVSPEQGWTGHTAPVRRVLADVIADGGPREAGPTLSFVQWVKQAGRVAEIIRALGRLWGRASITLPPAFCELEEGDWITWQSDRYAKGATITFQIEAWGSDKAWRHHLKLREVTAGAFGGAVLEDDGAVANQPAPPAAMLPPGIGTWTADVGYLASGDMKLPALVLEGAADDSRAQLVRVEYVQQTAAPDAGTVWTDAGALSPRATRREIPAAPGANYFLGVSYLVDGVPGPRRVLGPVTAGPVRYADGSIAGDLQPAAPGATRNTGALADKDQVGTSDLEDNAVNLGGSKVTGTLPTTKAAAGLVNDSLGFDFSANKARLKNHLGGVIDEWDLVASGGLDAGAVAESALRKWAAENGANVTETRVASAIAGQGALATRETIEDGFLAGNLAARIAPHPADSNYLSMATLAYPDGANADVLQPQEPGANVTANWTAAAVAGQGALATKSSVIYTSDLTNIPAAIQPSNFFAGGELKASLIYNVAGNKELNTYYPEDIGSNRTENRTAAAIVGQGAFATKSIANFFGDLQGLPSFMTDGAANAGTQNVRPRIAYMNYDDGTSGEHLKPGELGANKTETRSAASIAGQAATATNSDFSAITGATKPESNADVTATAQRTITPQFPVIEVKHGEAGHTGNRTVTHAAKKGTSALSGGTWSLPSENLGTGDASIDAGTGTVTLSGIVQSGAYTVRYTHTDGIATDLPVNVTYVPSPTAGTTAARTKRETSNTGVPGSGWSQVISMTIADCPAGRLFFNFGLNQVEVASGSGSCHHRARLKVNGSVVLTGLAQETVSGGAVMLADFSGLFADAYTVAQGNVTVAVELERTQGTGSILSMTNQLDCTVLAS